MTLEPEAERRSGARVIAVDGKLVRGSRTGAAAAIQRATGGDGPPRGGPGPAARSPPRATRPLLCTCAGRYRAAEHGVTADTLQTQHDHGAPGGPDKAQGCLALPPTAPPRRLVMTLNFLQSRTPCYEERPVPSLSHADLDIRPPSRRRCRSRVPAVRAPGVWRGLLPGRRAGRRLWPPRAVRAGRRRI